MVSDLDIYRTARLVIDSAVKEHPRETAVSNMIALYEKGDTEGFEVWVRIVHAVDILLNDNPDGVFH